MGQIIVNLQPKTVKKICLVLTRKIFPVLVGDDVLLEVGLLLAAHHALVGLEGEVILAGLALGTS